MTLIAPTRLLPQRRTARLILLDPDHRMLLIRYRTTPPVAPPYADFDSIWFTPGGGLEPGETTREAAARELKEETGLRLPIGPEVARREEDVTFFIKKVCVVERYFVVRAEHAHVDTALLADTEDDDVIEVRWVSAEELKRLDGHLEPPALRALALRIMAGDLPTEPVNLARDG